MLLMVYQCAFDLVQGANLSLFYILRAKINASHTLGPIGYTCTCVLAPRGCQIINKIYMPLNNS